ncbi:hypothetical protein, partial [Staphylococcus aureus]|uniref:hypothetical protein n=1 Tax=Staphylococcus aureus TaxID=1280 RepID=UPI001C7DD5AD
ILQRSLRSRTPYPDTTLFRFNLIFFIDHPTAAKIPFTLLIFPLHDALPISVARNVLTPSDAFFWDLVFNPFSFA